MRILHIGNIAGIPQELSRAQKKMGFKSDVLSFYPHPFGYEVDIYFPVKRFYPLNHVEKVINILKILSKYDIIHFHFSSALPRGFDVMLWKFLRRRVIIHHHGSDIRYKGEKLFYSKFADKILVSTPDLLEWSPDAIWIPNPLNLDNYPYIGVKNNSEEIKIVHAPSRRDIKGTKYVIEAVRALKNEGYGVNLILVENMPHNEVMEYYKQADIIVDQLVLGCYGMVSIECMALGKPVVCYLREDLKKYYKICPIVNADPQNLTEELRTLIEDCMLRKKISKRGRKYVERVHDARRIAKKVLSIYLEAGHPK